MKILLIVFSLTLPLLLFSQKPLQNAKPTGDSTLITVGNDLEAIKDTLKSVVAAGKKDGVSTAWGWLVYFLSLGMPFLVSIVTRFSRSWKMVRALLKNSQTSNIVIWVSIAGGGILEIIMHGFRGIDMTAWGAKSFIIYGIAIAVYEMLIRPLFGPTPSVKKPMARV